MVSPEKIEKRGSPGKRLRLLPHRCGWIITYTTDSSPGHCGLIEEGCLLVRVRQCSALRKRREKVVHQRRCRLKTSEVSGLPVFGVSLAQTRNPVPPNGSCSEYSPLKSPREIFVLITTPPCQHWLTTVLVLLPYLCRATRTARIVVDSPTRREAWHSSHGRANNNN